MLCDKNGHTFATKMGVIPKPLPQMPILGSSDSAANKNMIFKNIDKWGYNFLIE